MPVLMLHVLVTLLIFGLSLWFYMLITPHNELGLVRQGNTAAALSLGGAALGLALPLGICLYSAINIWDIILWGSAALVLQIVIFKLLDLILRDLPNRRGRILTSDPQVFLRYAKQNGHATPAAAPSLALQADNPLITAQEMVKAGTLRRIYYHVEKAG